MSSSSPLSLRRIVLVERVDHLAALAGQLVEPSGTQASDQLAGLGVIVGLEIRRHRHVHIRVAEHAVAADLEYGLAGDVHGVANAKLHFDLVTVARQRRRLGHRADAGAGKQHIGTFDQAAGVGETHADRVKLLYPLPCSPKDHGQRRDDAKADEQK